MEIKIGRLPLQWKLAHVSLRHSNAGSRNKQRIDVRFHNSRFEGAVEEGGEQGAHWCVQVAPALGLVALGNLHDFLPSPPTRRRKPSLGAFPSEMRLFCRRKDVSVLLQVALVDVLEYGGTLLPI